MRFSEATRVTAGAEVLVFLSVAIFVYYWRPARKGASTVSLRTKMRLLPPRRAKFFFSACMLTWLLILLIRTLPILPYLGTFLNAAWTFGSSAGLAGIFYLFCLMGLGHLKQLERALLILVVLIGVIVSFATGFLVGGTWILTVCLIAFTLGRGKLPLTPMLLGLLIVNFLQAGKAEMRAEFWRDGQGSVSSVSDFSDIYAYWLESSWNAITRQSQSSDPLPTVFDRQSLIQMQSLVTQNTPDRLPFLAGDTYAQIPELIAPRFLWPDKPDGHLSDETLGIYYGIQTEESITHTSIGFGLLGEAWANFGWEGMIGLAALFALAMRRVAGLSRGLPINSLYSILSVVWLAWSFQVENCLSSWLISLGQTLLVSLLLFYPLSVRRILAPGNVATDTDTEPTPSRPLLKGNELGASYR
jgi:hypothetical protein